MSQTHILVEGYMVSGLPCTVGFVQGLHYDTIQYREKFRQLRETIRLVFHTIQGHLYEA